MRSADVNFGAATLAVAIDPGQTELPDVFRAVRRLGYDTVERRAQDDGPAARGAGRTSLARLLALRAPRAGHADLRRPDGGRLRRGRRRPGRGAVALRRGHGQRRRLRGARRPLQPARAPGRHERPHDAGDDRRRRHRPVVRGGARRLPLRPRHRCSRSRRWSARDAPSAASWRWRRPRRPCCVPARTTALEEKTIDAAEIVVGDVVVRAPRRAGGGRRRRRRGRRARPTRRRSPASRARSPRRPATRSSPARSSRAARCACAPPPRPPTRPSPRSSTWSRRRRRSARPQRPSSTASPHVHAGRRRAGGGRRLRAAAARRLVRHLVLPRPRAAHHQLSLRARHLHPGEHPRGARPRDEQRRAHQGRRLPGADGRAQGGRLRQDGDAHAGPPAGDRRRPAERRLAGQGAAASPRRSSATASTRWRARSSSAPSRPRPRHRSSRSRLRRSRAPAPRPAAAQRAPPRPADRAARHDHAAHDHDAHDPAHDGHAHAGRGPDVERFRAIPGRGVRAELDGRLHFVGRPDLLGVHAVDPALVAAGRAASSARARPPSWSATRTARSA